jgi:hypothetical protein
VTVILLAVVAVLYHSGVLLDLGVALGIVDPLHGAPTAKDKWTLVLVLLLVLFVVLRLRAVKRRR